MTHLYYLSWELGHGCFLLGSHQAAVNVLARANLVWRLHWEKDPLPCLRGCWQLSIPCSCGTENLRFFADSWKEGCPQLLEPIHSSLPREAWPQTLVFNQNNQSGKSKRCKEEE